MQKFRWWKTYDYKSGHSYILGEQFQSKADALEYAKKAGILVIGKSTKAISDKEYYKEGGQGYD